MIPRPDKDGDSIAAFLWRKLLLLSALLRHICQLLGAVILKEL